MRPGDRKPGCAWCGKPVQWDNHWCVALGDTPTAVRLLVCSDTCDMRPNGAKIDVRDMMDLEVR